MIKRLLIKPQLLRSIPKYFNSQEVPDYTSLIEQKVSDLQAQQPFFDRLILFDPEILATLPKVFDRLDPVVETGKDILVGMHDYLGIPWWGVLGVACLTVRTTLIPLIYLQMKRSQKLAAVIPALVQMKRLIDTAQCSKTERFYYQARVAYEIISKQKLKFMRLFLYNLFNIPLLITTVWSIRRLLVEESVKNTPFLWIDSLAVIDPYYILPILTVAGYYYNLQRFITPENRDTLPSRIRSIAQLCIIGSLPFLCNWPAAIILYMFYNSMISLIQTTVIIHPSFQKFVDPKMFLYMLVVSRSELDNKQSEALVESIISGDETCLHRAIEEERLVEQIKQGIIAINNKTIDQKTELENLYDRF